MNRLIKLECVYLPSGCHCDLTRPGGEDINVGVGDGNVWIPSRAISQEKLYWIMLREISQTEKDKQFMVSHVESKNYSYWL